MGAALLFFFQWVGHCLLDMLHVFLHISYMNDSLAIVVMHNVTQIVNCYFLLLLQVRRVAHLSSGIP